MHQVLPGLNSYLYDGHGHSTASDGLHPPELIVEMAVKKGLDIIGLSDHNLVTNLPRFLAHADKINKDGVKILPIPSLEMSSNKGDVLVALPDRDMAENFLRDYKKPTKRLHPLEFIEDYIEKYNAIIVLLHPEVKYVNSLSFDEIRIILERVPKKFHKNMGIEIYNWMTQAFFWTRHKKEKIIHKENGIWELAPFSFTDYHSALHVGNGSTLMKMTELSSQAFIEAVQNRRTAPHTISNRSIPEYMEIVKATLIAESISKFGKRNFRIPREKKLASASPSKVE